MGIFESFSSEIVRPGGFTAVDAVVERIAKVTPDRLAGSAHHVD